MSNPESSRCGSRHARVSCFKEDGHIDEHAGIAKGGGAVYWPNEPERWVALDDLALMIGRDLDDTRYGMDLFVKLGHAEWSEDGLFVRIDRSILDYTRNLLEDMPEAETSERVDRLFSRGHRFGLLEADPDEFKGWLKDEGIA